MTEFDIEKIGSLIEEEARFISEIKKSLKEVIIGQDDLIEKLILSILADGLSILFIAIIIGTLAALA